MKLGIDATNIKSGGGAVHLIELLNRFSKEDDVEIIVWCNTVISKSLIESENIRIISLNRIFNNPIIRAFWQIIFLASSAKKLSCDVLFFPGGSYIGTFRPFVSMSQNMLPFSPLEINRYSFSLRKIKLLILKYWQQLSFINSQGIIFLSLYAKKIISGTIDISSSKHAVIPHGINKKFFLIKKKKFDKFFPKAVYVSTIDEYKHHEKVIRAIGNLKNNGIHVQLDIIGSSYKPALKRLKRSIQSLDLKNSINILGAINNSDIAKKFQEYDFAIFASSCENQPIALLEKMASGLPICCSSMEPMPEVLLNGGLYFDPLSVDDIERTIKKIISCDQSREKISRISKELSFKYNWEETSAKTIHFLREVSNSFKTRI